MVPAFITAYKRPSALGLARGLVYCSLCSFLFGYHVHEKAILVPLVLQTLLIFSKKKKNFISIAANIDVSNNEMQVYDSCGMYLFFILSIAGIFGLFPLFTENRELYVKTVLYVIYIGFVYAVLNAMKRNEISSSFRSKALHISPIIIIVVFIALFLYNEIVHNLVEIHIIHKKLEFLTLLLTSMTCAVFLLYALVLAFNEVVTN